MLLFVCLGCLCAGCQWCRGRKSAWTPRPPSWSRRFATCRISCCPSVNRGSTRRRRSSVSTGWESAWRWRRLEAGGWWVSHWQASQSSQHFDFVPLQALEEALNLHSPSSSQQPPGQANFADAANNLKKQELLTQIAVLKEQVRHSTDGCLRCSVGKPPVVFSTLLCFSQQVKIFEEDFRKERSDRERMNEEKEDLRRQVERLQGQITNLTNQVTHGHDFYKKEGRFILFGSKISKCCPHFSASSSTERMPEGTHREMQAGETADAASQTGTGATSGPSAAQLQRHFEPNCVIAAEAVHTTNCPRSKSSCLTTQE